MNDKIHPDATPFQPRSELSRREFVVSSLAAGFALAVQPARADAVIRTDSDGLVAGEVKIPVGDGDMPAYRAMPAGKGPFPTVLVVQEIFGVHEHIRDVCRRFAKAGYFAVAPELYARQGEVSKLASIDDIIKVVQKVPDAQVMSDLDKTVAWAKAGGSADTARLGVTGFCWGGRITWLYAAHNPAVKAGTAWYGRLVGKSSEMTPKHPVDLAAELKAPVLGLYGALDKGISLDTVEQMRAALKAAGKPGEIVVYPDADHGFHADYRPTYNKEAAADGFKRLLAWFKQHGAA
ncbi:dienelactone hydrolase family protein [Chitinimonas sp.]|uniref:dienelactone hydrolase family protein n=1 Tax=Chitinimonas sp. TaxID=1934313 RepID=UPI0035B0EDD8